MFYYIIKQWSQFQKVLMSYSFFVTIKQPTQNWSMKTNGWFMINRHEWEYTKVLKWEPHSRWEPNDYWEFICNEKIIGDTSRIEFGQKYREYTKEVAQRCSVKKIYLEIPKKSKENTCARVSFLIKLQASVLQLY